MRKEDKKCFKYKKPKHIAINYPIKKNKKIVVNNIKIKNSLTLKMADKYKKSELKNK